MAARAASFSLDDAAAFLGVSRRTVYNRIGEGRLVTIRTMGGSQRVLVASAKDCLATCRNARKPAPAVARPVNEPVVPRREEDVPLPFGSI